MAVSKQPTITPETSSGEGLDEEPSSRGEAKWKRFHPFRVVRKIFRRRIKREGTNVVSDSSKKSWSTSELQSVQDDSTGKCEVTSPLKIGLSVSHDSIFSPENNSNIVSNETLNVPHGSSLSVRHTSMKNMFKDELFTRIRARRDSDDDGIGMQNSPYSSPTTVDILNQGFKEKLPKSQTTCSAGSLISMGSSENDEDSTGQSSGHSSRMSLIDRRSLDSEADSEVANPVPLNHNAAHHKIAIRPKRTYGLPRRRMRQIAAAKVTSLPSTPEVTEDLSKCLQQLEVTEIIKSTTEFSIMSEKEIISSAMSSEKHTSSHSSTVSYSEISQFTSETQSLKDKVFCDPGALTKSDINEDLKRISFHHDMKPEALTPTADDVKTNSESVIDENVSDLTHKTSNILNDCKQSLANKNNECEMESYKLIKNTMQEKPKCDSMFQDYLNTPESSISVSSLVKNIEKSDSFRSTDKSRKSLEDSKLNIEKHLEHPESPLENKRTKEFESETDLKHIEESRSRSMHGIQSIVEEFSESISLGSTQDLKMASPADCVNEIFKRSTVSDKLDLDIESEFVLKPFKKDRRFSGENDSPYADALPEKQKDSSLVSSVYLEEESIMSNKSLSVGIEESRIFVSHHTSFSDDLKDILVTEAHNYAAVEEKSEVSIQSVEGTVSSKEKDTCDPYISSVGISSSVASDHVTYTSSSALSDKRMAEDKITISINSNSDVMESSLISPPKDDGISRTSLQKSSIHATETGLNQKAPEKQPKSTPKSHLPDISSNTVSTKNTNSQKRVSVEIVPFSQRMKERKYQPISFANKECSSENKKNSSAQVERKLSDRKVTKNKDLDKSNNRHSFSGTITSDNKMDGALVSGKKEVKNEKMQYPVQIRIHKSSPKPEIKDKNITTNTSSEFKNANKEGSADVKFLMHSSKVSQNEIKLLKDENKSVESTPKWEIKIQPASSSSPHASVSQTSSSEETNSSVLSQRNFILKSESFKSSQFSGNENKDTTTDLESSATKSQDGTWKSKDSTVLSDDPEPELLRVFARRSIKQKHCDKSKPDETEKNSDTTLQDPVVEITDKNKDMISISLNSTVIKISENSKPHITKPDLKKKSKSFCEKEKAVPRSVSPLKEMNLIQRDSLARSSADSLISSEMLHPRQRIVNLDDAPLTLPPESEKKTIARSAQNESTAENSLPSKEEQSHRSCSISTPPPGTSINGSLSSIGMVKENQDVIAGKEAHTPAWLQLAQQRRELREQRERLLLGGSPNSFMDASSKPSRSSKVWDMVNNFQKLQMT